MALGRTTSVGAARHVVRRHTSAAVTLLAFTKSPEVTVECAFGGSAATFSSACTAWYSAANHSGPLAVSVRGSDGSRLDLDHVDFIWDHPAINHSAGDYRQGQKGAVMEAFGWRHIDVQNECAFLAKAGYLGVKMFPVHEQLMSSQPFNDVMNPWYEVAWVPGTNCAPPSTTAAASACASTPTRS